MKPYIVCHMMASVDGRIDCAMTEQMEPSNVYYDALEQLECSTTLEGRVSMQMHFACPEPFVAQNRTPIGCRAFHKAVEAEGYSVAVDTMGKLRWPSATHYGTPFLVLVSEDCAKEYLDTLTAQGISWISVGKGGIDLKAAVELLHEEFGVQRLAVVGGGHINGAFLQAGLLDEVSVMIGPGIDGRAGKAAVFDGITAPHHVVTLLRLRSVEQMGQTVWLRYGFA